MEVVNYWTEEFLMELRNSRDFLSVGNTAIKVIKTMPKPVYGISAPITTGGYNLEDNLRIINGCVEELALSCDLNIFNIVPLELGIRPLKEQWKKAGNKGYCTPIIEVTYKKIFESFLLERVYFAPNQSSSIGAAREKEILLELGIPVFEIPNIIWKKVLKKLGLVCLNYSEVVVF